MNDKQYSNIAIIIMTLFILIIGCNNEYSAEDHYYKANRLNNQGLLDEAILEYNKAINLDSSLADAYSGCARAYSKKDELDSAINILSIVIKYYPLNYDAIYTKGLLLSVKGEYLLSINEFDIVIGYDPNKIGVYSLRGYSYLKLGENDQAITDFSKEISLNEESFDAYLNRGLCYHRIGEYNSAINDYGKAIALNPRDSKSYNNRGLSYHRIGEYNSAIDDYGMAITHNPRDHMFYNNRGESFRELQKYNEAFEDYGKSLSLDSTYAYCYHSIATAYYKLGETDKELGALKSLLHFWEPEDKLNIDSIQSRVNELEMP